MRWSRARDNISVGTSVVEDPDILAILQPYKDLFTAYNESVVGQTTVPIDALQAYTQETNGANLQADSAVFELETNVEDLDVDFHLSGAMSNRKVPIAADATYPYTLTVADMFTLMPYENSLVVMEMNGPQIKAVLERAYRNYYYYKYVTGYGGYSYYTTCMLDTNAGSKITYFDMPNAPYDPEREYVISLEFTDEEDVVHQVDFEDADTYYNVSTVNYLAAGSCNFNDAGATLWPLDQIVADTQFYVRDAVIHYIQEMGTVSPMIEGRLVFVQDVEPPVITIESPEPRAYLHPEFMDILFSAEDVGLSGLKDVWADLDGAPVENGDVIDLLTLSLGQHTLTVYAVDYAGNEASKSVTFTVEATMESLKVTLERLYDEGKIDGEGLYKSLMVKLVQAEKRKSMNTAINVLQAFMNELEAQSGKHITTGAANLLLADVQYVIDHIE